jgi:twitching motility protein PilI
MNTVNASLVKLLEYDQRASGETSEAGVDTGKGDWAGLAFRVGDTSLVCSLERIDESLPLPQVTRVPGTKSFILGLANVRGDLITIVDLGCFLNGTRSTPSVHSRLLSASLRGRPVGLLVDQVFGQRNFVAGDADQPGLPDDSPLRGLVRKQHRSGSDYWLELDLDSLFSNAGFLDGAAA